jgi:hypothetical protein
MRMDFFIDGEYETAAPALERQIAQDVEGSEGYHDKRLTPGMPSSQEAWFASDNAQGSGFAPGK